MVFLFLMEAFDGLFLIEMLVYTSTTNIDLNELLGEIYHARSTTRRKFRTGTPRTKME